jgi:hypothetical protein
MTVRPLTQFDLVAMLDAQSRSIRRDVKKLTERAKLGLEIAPTNTALFDRFPEQLLRKVERLREIAQAFADTREGED